MALTLVIIPPAQPVVANQTMNYVASVTNSGATSVTLSALVASELTESDAQLAQPLFLTPNVPPGVGNPVLLPGVTYFYPFQAVFNSPLMAGASPNAPGGSAPSSSAVTPDAIFGLSLQSQSSDGTIASVTQQVAVQTAAVPFPIPLGGALQMYAGANLINFLTA